MKPYESEKNVNKIPMRARLDKLVFVIIIPMVFTFVLLIGLLLGYTMQYKSILKNVTAASEFNQDFKSDVDLKMFYFVSESAYADGMPLDEVAAARELAEELSQNTTEKNSIEAIESVKSLCDTLKLRMADIEAAESYDERMQQLETNIYILTDLIQTYMYNYLYYESVHLSSLQNQIVYQISVIIIILTVGVIALLVGLSLYAKKITNRITEPLTKLTQRVEDISTGDFDAKEPIEASEVEIQTLSDGFENMVSRLNDLIDENHQAERRKRHAELELLQAQINPHFLYNTLDTIVWLIESDEKQKSVDMVLNLSDFFRSSLSRGQDIIKLSEEQKHVLAYLEIQKTRYVDRMDYEVDIPENLHEYMIPKLTLQPLVENSIYHGIKMQRNKGQIRVSAIGIGDNIEIKVVDNGAGMDEERLSKLRAAIECGEKVGFGLRTVDERLKLLFGDEYGLSVDSTLGVGTIITIIIPKKKSINNDEVL